MEDYFASLDTSFYINYCSIYQKSIVFDLWSEFSILDSSKDTPYLGILEMDFERVLEKHIFMVKVEKI